VKALKKSNNYKDEKGNDKSESDKIERSNPVLVSLLAIIFSGLIILFTII
jgi:hypothetical protein